MIDAPYKPDRFDRVVDYYIEARPTYAPRLIEWLARETAVEGHAVLDLGCGPGFIANAISPFASAVLGLDPSPNMIAAARASARPNVRFEIGSSEDLSAVEAAVRLVTIGRAFHWMDRDRTLLDLERLVGEGGAIALIQEAPAKLPMNRWWDCWNAVAKSFAVLDEFNQHRLSDEWVPHEQILSQSAFSELRSLSVYQTHVWSFDTLLRLALSRSATTEALLGSRLFEMEAAMREALAPFGPGPWISLNQHTALIATRPGSLL